jgi:actin-related protein 8
MKRDDQILPSRLQNEANREKMIRHAKDKDRALARTGNTDVPIPTNVEGDPEDEEAEDDEQDNSKIIVIHPGSQNLRIGFASDALPKTIPMCIAEQWKQPEYEEYEARPKQENSSRTPEQLFGEDFNTKYTKMSNDLKIDMRANKRKVLPNSKELVVNFNRRTPPELVQEHNDATQIEWTDVSVPRSKNVSPVIFGQEAQRIPDDSQPPYKLRWPIQHGWLNDADFPNKAHLLMQFDDLLEGAIKKDLGLSTPHDWQEYSVVFVIPDLYDKNYVQHVLDLCLKTFQFKQICFIQESLAATYGAGYTSACIVDIGAQKTSICCVEDGMCLEDSRINLKYGGYDITECFIKMMIHDHFPYSDINLKRRYDFLLAEELKIKYCTMNQAEISVQLYDFHLRIPSQPTRRYQFKTYDEVILAPMGLFDPSIFDHSDKLKGRHAHIPFSFNPYDVDTPDDPTSTAQLEVLTTINPSVGAVLNSVPNGLTNLDASTPSKEKSNPLNLLSRLDNESGNSRINSAAASPAPEGTPGPSGPFVPGLNGTNGSPGPGGANLFSFGTNGSHNSGTPQPPTGLFVTDPLHRTAKSLAEERDKVLPISPIHTAILTSIRHAAKGDEKKVRDFAGGIMVIGGGGKTPGFGAVLEEKLKKQRPDLADKILVGTSPREMEPQVVVWKGASVFGRMQSHESWVGQKENECLGSRCLYTKVIWFY